MITDHLIALGKASKSIPADTKAMFRLSLLDWIACGIAGGSEPVAGPMRALAEEEGGTPLAQVIGGPRVPVRMAALVNGTISHALDYDDTHFAHIGHPSVAVIPAALAMAERVSAPGKDFQRAALIGAEASVRFGVWLGRDHYQRGFHQTATAGAFGATLACAILLDLDEKHMRAALNIVATRASGLKSQFGSMGKPLNAGIAAANGVEAAMLAQSGFEAAADAVEGVQGFGPTHHGQAKAIRDVWQFDTISHKFHACCHGLHAALEAIAPLADRCITQVQVETHPRWLNVCNIAEPETGLEAKFSYRQVLAMAMTGQDTRAMTSYTRASCADLAAKRQMIDVSGDGALSETQARLRLTLSDGSISIAEHDLSAPMSFANRQERLNIKSDSLIGEERTNLAIDLIATEASATEFAKLLAWLGGEM